MFQRTAKKTSAGAALSAAAIVVLGYVTMPSASLANSDEIKPTVLELPKVDCATCHLGEPDKTFPEIELSAQQVASSNYIKQLLEEFDSNLVIHIDELVIGDALAGQNLAKNLCATCHALDAGKPSPNEAAPNFNTLTLTYPPEHLAEGFAEGIVVGTDAHIGMPQFELAPEQIDDLIAYLETVMPPYISPNAAEGRVTD